MKVAFALFVHRMDDDRVAFQEAEALKKSGDSVVIFSAYEKDGLTRKEKMQWLQHELEQFDPTVIICDTPLSVYVAHQYAKTTKRDYVKVVYDVTEWYPSKKNLRNVGLFKKMARLFILSILSLGAGIWTDAFIFGEIDKSFPFKYLFFWKPQLMLSYYAPLGRVTHYPAKTSLQDECVLYYSGNLTKEKGFFRVVSLVIELSKIRPNTKFIVRIVSSSSSLDIPKLPSNLIFEYQPWMPFPQFCAEVGKADLFLDIRDNDFENTRCLPIKLFYYMMAGRPMIYSNLKAIRKGVSEFDSMGCLVRPDCPKEVLTAVLNYVDNSELYRNHCQNSLNLSMLKYNWEKIENKFIEFIHHGI